jgi:flagellar basal-body rod protein FlgB
MLEEESMDIFGDTMKILERTLDLRAARQQVIASNIANEETPGYRAKELRFQDALAAASQQAGHLSVRVTHEGHQNSLGFGTPVRGQIVDAPSGDLPLDANSVNLEMEMAKLSDNALQYNTAAQIIAREFRGLLSAIREGR